MLSIKEGRSEKNITTFKYLKDYQSKELWTYCVVLKKAKPNPKKRTGREATFSLIFMCSK